MKKLAKSRIVSILGWQVKRLTSRSNFKTIGVVGSMGKTSTKLSIAQYLSSHYKVQFQDGNYNDIVTVPLVIFGHVNPSSLINPIAWVKILLSNELQILKRSKYDFIVLELGVDGPGQMEHFGKYLKIDLLVITAISVEHMEFFKSIDSVAIEELAATKFSNMVVVNIDLCKDYINNLPGAVEYGLTEGKYYFSKNKKHLDKHDIVINHNSSIIAEATVNAISELQLYSLLAAVAVGDELGIPREEIVESLDSILPVPGRMNSLQGLNNSIIIDDTYNASPAATISAINTLKSIDAAQRIALLGNMNELGDFSENLHTEVGQHCDPSKINLVVTLGPDANKFISTAAAAKGCIVMTAKSPYEAAEIIKQRMTEGAVILAKGSQNGVFAEEAVKQLLKNKSDTTKLVRQSKYWLEIKRKQFNQ